MKAKRFLAVLMTAAMVLTSLPMTAFAVDCPHHVHTATCGYREGTEGAECTHEHDGTCYPTVQNFTTGRPILWNCWNVNTRTIPTVRWMAAAS